MIVTKEEIQHYYDIGMRVIGVIDLTMPAQRLGLAIYFASPVMDVPREKLIAQDLINGDVEVMKK